ncbi:ATP-binding cassette domain-containing protein [Ruminococcus sp. OM05-10BH]|nr:ATP-binding cassette domain-containing protein [Ruminococcus sp. OM05-10BH]
MLQIKHIRKEYRTGKLVQKALDDVSLNLRDNEFVAILGPSGSGKTTLLNIVGGLDRYDSGDLIINGISTKKYKDRDWDSYRNHTIGFVFQSYNLIPHQTILANVELALTISGVGKAERRERAQKALEEVGLGEQSHKKPNQLSGGQMQRVAIARALVNDPDILLADEPTGALDSATSVQVMDLLREVAKDRLVVMVTHNPELAEEYATRIVNLKDGRIRSDSNPYEVDETAMKQPEHQNMGKSSMSLLTALSLSFNNLRTKKARTLLTSFAGSIGIIGIALILALSTGVNQYIQSVEEDTLSEYPLEIQSTGIDMTAMLGDGGGEEKEAGDVDVIQMVSNMFSTMDSNDLESLKKYLESGESDIKDYTNAVEYSYSVSPQIYREDGDSIRQVNPDRSFDALGFGSASGSNSMMSSMMSTDMFYEMPENENLYKGQYDVKAGRWPENYNECVVVLTANGNVSDFMLYTLGLRDAVELDEMIRQFINEEDIETPENMGSYSYEDFLGITFKLVNSADYYTYDSQYGVWTDKSGNETYMKDLVKNGEDLKVVGVVQPAEDANAVALSSGIGYPSSLTRHVAEEAEDSEIVKQQIANPDVNVFTGETFGETESQNGLDMNSLFTVNTDALENAFQFNSDALSGSLSGAVDFSDLFQMDRNTLDLSGMVDLSGIQIELPDAGSLNLNDLMGNLNLTVSTEGMTKLARNLISGYQDYAKEHPEADYSGLSEDFAGYLKSTDAQKILKENILEIIESNGGITASVEQIHNLFREVLSGFMEYASEHGYTDSERFDEYLLEYLQTPAAAEIINSWGSRIFDSVQDISITTEQLQKIAREMAAGYLDYAEKNQLPDLTKMDDYFVSYLNTDAGKEALSSGISEIVDMESLQSQVGTALETYMKEVMGAYTGAISNALETQISSAMSQVVSQMSSGMETVMQRAMSRVGTSLQEAMGDAMTIDADAFANAFEMNMSEEELSELMMSMQSTGETSYDSNLRNLGYVDFDVPTGIAIYPKDFESKEEVVKILDGYNSQMEAQGKDEQVITYTDMVGTLMSSVTDIIDIISYVLIAFVAISLVVSSIMIGVITYISVLERKKEIGILRAIGASKGNISQVFNAETFIIGLCAGLIGIGLTLLLLIPGNALIHHLADTNEVSAVLPVVPALILIALSVVLTLLGGLIPSRKAAKSDPVTALRTE